VARVVVFAARIAESGDEFNWRRQLKAS
jgi:hypothetical protein